MIGPLVGYTVNKDKSFFVLALRASDLKLINHRGTILLLWVNGTMTGISRIWTQFSHQFCTSRMFIEIWTASVTRFGEISALWQNLQSLGQLSGVYLLFGKILNLLWQILYTFGQIFIDVNGQMLKIM